MADYFDDNEAETPSDVLEERKQAIKEITSKAFKKSMDNYLPDTSGKPTVSDGLAEYVFQKTGSPILATGAATTLEAAQMAMPGGVAAGVKNITGKASKEAGEAILKKGIKIGEYGDIEYKTKIGKGSMTPSSPEDMAMYDNTLETFSNKIENPIKLEDIHSFVSGKGSNILDDMEKAAKSQGHDAIYLNASPIPNAKTGEKISLDSLIKFYKKNGYSIANHEGTNAVMFKKLNAPSDELAGRIAVPNYREEQKSQDYAEGGLVSKNKLVTGSLDRIKSKSIAPTETAEQDLAAAYPQVTQEQLDAELALMDAEDKMAAAPNNTISGSSEYSHISDEEVIQELINEEKYGDKFVETAALQAAGTLSAGAIPKLLEMTGAYEPGEILKKQEYNPSAVPVGTVLGIGGAILAPELRVLGSAGKLTTVGAAESLGVAAESIVANLLKNRASKSVIQKGVAHLAKGAVEGGTFAISELANEAAIGKTSFNGENILGYGLSGALMGGVTGIALPTVGAGVRALGRGGKKLFDKSLKSVGEPADALFDLMGVEGTLRTKIDTDPSMQSFKGESLDWFSKKFTADDISSGPKMLERFQKVENNAKSTADELIDSAGMDLQSNLPQLTTKYKDTQNTILSKVNSKIEDIAENSRLRGNDPAIPELMKLRNATIERLDEIAKVEAKGQYIPFTPKMYRNLRQSYDKGSKYTKDSIDDVMEINRDAREVLNDAMHSLVSLSDSARGAALKEAFKDMRYVATLKKSLSKKVSNYKPNFIQKIGDIFQAAGLVQLAGGPGAVIAGGLKFVNSDMARRMVVLKAIDKANKATEVKTASAIKNFLYNPKTAKKTQTASALMASHFGRDENKKEPKNQQEAYQNVAKNLTTFIVEPEKLIDRTTKATAAISHAAPETAAAASSKMINAVQFLQSKIPKNPYAPQLPGMKPRPYTPSSMDLAKFESYMQIIEMPLTVLDELQSGTLTRAHIEAMQAVYPEMYEYIRTSMINQMQESSDVEMSYTKRVQTSILLDIVSDNSLMGQNILALQANFKVQEQPEGGSTPVVQPTAGGAEKLKSSERAATDTEAFMRRRSEN